VKSALKNCHLVTSQNKEAASWDSEEFAGLVKKKIFANNLLMK